MNLKSHYLGILHTISKVNLEVDENFFNPFRPVE